MESSQPSAHVEPDNSDNLLVPTGELIGAVERAVKSTGFEFADLFRAIRIEMGDDYPFLDPTLGGFEYSNGVVKLRARPSRAVYVNALTDSLRRLVNKLATDRQGTRFRERVAVELAIAARRQPNALADFTVQLDRIAGTRVL